LLLLAQKPKSLLELGCGQGPDALFLAGKGVRVSAIDTSAVGIAQLTAKARERGISLNASVRDMRDPPAGRFDAILSRMALQLIAPNERHAFLISLKTKYSDAIHAHIVPITSACFGDGFICEDTLLTEAYADWETLFYEEAWTISRERNAKGEPYLLREARIIARAHPPKPI
jgi:SAM-dependent methyltransferase